MPTKSPLSGARRADLTGLGVHRRGGSALPKSVERGNLTLNKALIRWKSVYSGLEFRKSCAPAEERRERRGKPSTL